MWKWYGVKSLYRVHALGKPDDPDEHYDARSTLIEERVVLFRARSFDEALRKGESEAQKYAKAYQEDGRGGRPSRLENPYGQRLSMRYLGALDAFEVSERPDAGVEVFSSTSLVSNEVSDGVLVDAHFGENEEQRGVRTKFLNRRLAGKGWWVPRVPDKRPRKR